MYRNLITLFMLLIGTTVAFAAPVDRQSAAVKAKAFLAHRRGSTDVSLSLAMQGRHQVIGKGKPVQDSFYYVFNNGDDEGFVIMSGDDSTPDVLGYADSGRFDMNQIPDNMKAWLDCYAEQIAWARAKVAVTRGTDEPQYARMAIAPLLETCWNQNPPYNLECFTASNELAKTGCVATAFAQIMYYHRSPKSATTEIPAYDADGGSYSSLPSVTFDWDSMKNTYSSDETLSDPSVKAIADLLLYCGHAVQMDYGTDGSSGSIMNCPTALKEYFGYANPGSLALRSSFTAEAWEALVYNELLHGRPVLYSGSSASGTGHAFVCDGYDGEGLFHINWGWGGLSDGYFRLQAVNPSSQGTGGSLSGFGYSLKQHMITGISPVAIDDGAPSSFNRMRVDTLRIVKGNPMIYDYSGNSFSNVSVNYYYSAAVTDTYTIGFGLFKDGEMIQTKSVSSATIEAGYTYWYKSLRLSGLGANLSDGTYQIRCICQPSGATEWCLNDNADVRYLEVTIADGKATFVNKMFEPKLEVVDVEQLPDVNGRRQVRVSLRNVSEANFFDPIYLLVGGNLVSIENAQISAGQEDYVDFIFSKAEGTYQLDVAAGNKKNVVYTDPAFVIGTVSAPVQTQPEVVSSEVKNLDTANLKMFGTLTEASVTLRNNTGKDYEGTVKLTVYKKVTSSSYSYNTTTMNVKLAAGQTSTYVVDSHVASIGDEIWFDVEAAGKTNTIGSFWSAYTVCDGYVEWDALGVRTAKEITSSITVSASAVAASFEGLDVSKISITPNSNPNTIYYINGSASTPTRLVGKNVVKGRTASGAIKLKEGNDFFVPLAFDVTSAISYFRTPTASCDFRSGWQTINLPFEVKKVTCSGNKVDWSRSDTEKGDFWVKSFEGVDGDCLILTAVPTWIANEPYVIGTPSSMKGEVMEFSASNVKVQKTDVSKKIFGNYQMVGTQGDRTLSQAYLLNEFGSAFVLGDGEVKSGFAYFLSSDSSAPSKLRINKGMMGDVNGDGEINVTDVMFMVDYVLTGYDINFEAAYADLNNDKVITVADVALLVEIILK